MHGDVFRPPWSLVLLSAVVGTGAQLALLVLLVILMAIVGTLYVGYVLYFVSLATKFSVLAGFCSPCILIISGEEQSSQHS